MCWLFLLPCQVPFSGKTKALSSDTKFSKIVYTDADAKVTKAKTYQRWECGMYHDGNLWQSQRCGNHLWCNANPNSKFGGYCEPTKSNDNLSSYNSPDAYNQPTTYTVTAPYAKMCYGNILGSKGKDNPVKQSNITTSIIETPDSVA